MSTRVTRIRVRHGQIAGTRIESEIKVVCRLTVTDVAAANAETERQWLFVPQGHPQVSSEICKKAARNEQSRIFFGKM
jgi:hypothetical protein